MTAHPERSANWLALLNWGGSILSVPKRGGKRHNVTNVIKKRISSFDASPQCDYTPDLTRQNNKSSSALLAQAISAKLEDGNLKAAIRLLCSDDSPADPSPDTLQKLQEKHPPASDGIADLPAPQRDTALTVSEEDVRRAVFSFPAGSSGGPDGMRPQHLKDLLSCRDSGSDLLPALTSFTNTVMTGACPTDIIPIFFGGRLLALNKKSGGIRPIAVGLTLRRLASKCANSFGVRRLPRLFDHSQLGVGTPGGCEAAIHSARRYLRNLASNHKLDFANAGLDENLDPASVHGQHLVYYI